MDEREAGLGPDAELAEAFKAAERVRNAAMAACPYRNGTGVCDAAASCGYFGEPLCITSEPEGGWVES